MVAVVIDDRVSIFNMRPIFIERCMQVSIFLSGNGNHAAHKQLRSSAPVQQGPNMILVREGTSGIFTKPASAAKHLVVDDVIEEIKASK